MSENYQLTKRNAYKAVFTGTPTKPQQTIVLADLARICKANKTTIRYDAEGRIDPIASVGQELSRCVWLRISHHLNLSDGEIYKLLEQEQKMREESQDE
jgi:hypothetical protein